MMDKIGVVLGGGGVKGWTHIGVIKAIKELNIDVSVIAGTSSGSIAAACYAIDSTYEEILNNFTTIMSTLRKPFKLHTISFPKVSLFTGKKGTKRIEKVFSNYQMDNLPTSYFCISSNLSTLEEVVHTDGLLWQKIRASIAIPGLIPPMVLDNDVHLDGGLTNNLPVDVMRRIIGSDGKIIAVSVSGNKPDPKPEIPYDFPPILTNLELLKYYLGIKSYSFPRFSNILIKGLLMGAAEKEIEMCKQADILISPNLQDYNMLGITPIQEQELILLGYNQAKEALKVLQI